MNAIAMVKFIQNCEGQTPIWWPLKMLECFCAQDLDLKGSHCNISNAWCNHVIFNKALWQGKTENNFLHTVGGIWVRI